MLRPRLRTVAPVTVLIAALAAQPAFAAQYQDRIVSPGPVSWTPNVKDGVVNAVAQVANGEMVAAGSFTQVKRGSATAVTRHDMVAFSATNGKIDAGFAPDVEGGAVRSAVASADGSAVYIGGTFTSVNGVPAPHLAKIDFPGGRLDPAFSVSLSGTFVDKLVLANGKLYLGGSFRQVDGKNRSLVAAVDPATGALDRTLSLKFSLPRQGASGLVVNNIAVSPDGTKMLASGTFTQVNGLARDQLVMLDLTTSPVSVADWETDKFNHVCARIYDTYIRGIDFSPDGGYFVIGDTGAYSGGPADLSNDGSGLPTNQGSLCDSVSRWETGVTGSGITPTWVDYTGGDSITQIAVTGSAVYAGGHQRWQNNPFASDRLGWGGVPRTGIAALDPQNGMPFAWNPTRARGKGVFALLPTDSGLWVGSDTATFANVPRGRIAFLPLSGGEVVPPAMPGSLPGDLFSLGADGSLSRSSFDGTTLGAAGAANTLPGLPAGQVRAAFMLSGRAYVAMSDGNIYRLRWNGFGFNAGPAIALDGLPDSLATYRGLPAGFPVSSLTGMFYDGGRLYYTVSGDPHLYYRYFEAEDDMVGAQAFVASGDGDGLDWSQVQGLTMAGGSIYYADASGALESIGFAAGAPVPGTQQTVAAGPGHASAGMFLLAP